MAKLTGPCLSWDARGTLANLITYATRPGMTYARRYVKPRNPDTPDQRRIRDRYNYATDYWALINDRSDKIAWNRQAAVWSKGWSGYNACIHWFMTNANPELPGFNYGPVRNVRVTSVTAHTATVQFDVWLELDEYILFYSTGKGLMTYAVGSTTPGPTRTVTLQELSPRTTYWFYIEGNSFPHVSRSGLYYLRTKRST